jgi:hypothetical protein
LVDRIASGHSLKDIAPDLPMRVCTSRDDTPLPVDGVL